MTASSFKTCPTCGGRIADPRHRKRICARCHGIIKRNHKWGFGLDGRPEHRNCDNPGCYGTEKPAEQVKQAELAEVGKQE
jgi:hypothetical protein